MRHIIPISGKDSLTTAIVAKAQNPSIEFEYLYNTTFSDPPEIFAWLRDVEDYLKTPVHRVGHNLIDEIYTQGFLPSRLRRYCTRIAKIESMEQWIGDDDVTLYFGIRADEAHRRGFETQRDNITTQYPLIDLGINLPLVYRILEDRQLLPPTFFWRSMFHMVYSMLGDDSHLLAQLDRNAFYRLFAWRDRPNCWFCFNQRQYEWIGLYEHHRDLYWQASRIEQEVGGDGYYWSKDRPLTMVAQPEEMKRIKRNRAKAIVKQVYALTSPRLFDDDNDENYIDILAVTSCGLFCGK